MDHLGYYYSPFDWLLIVVTTTYPLDARGFLLLVDRSGTRLQGDVKFSLVVQGVRLL